MFIFILCTKMILIQFLDKDNKRKETTQKDGISFSQQKSINACLMYRNTKHEQKTQAYLYFRKLWCQLFQS